MRGMVKSKRMPGFAFKVMSLIHDNPLQWVFRNPYRLLKAAGLKPGQKVLEVGCGPGFFTIPAAKIVGEKGVIYALDNHPLAIKRVQEKLKKEGIENVKTKGFLIHKEKSVENLKQIKYEVRKKQPCPSGRLTGAYLTSLSLRDTLRSPPFSRGEA